VLIGVGTPRRLTFPMTGIGKVQKYVMREQMAEELGRTMQTVA
jgi:hypothetical protein